MKLFKHKDYESYFDAQVNKNLKKLDNIWVRKSDIKDISKFIKNKIPNASFGICHGVRNAWEVEKFREFLNINVIGTDISPTILSYPNSIQLDFHEVKPEWINSVDFIYSNSFDHSYDPELCLDRWMSCVKKGGFCFIQSTNKSNKNEKVDAADCFVASLDEYRKMFNKKYYIVDEIGPSSRIIFVIAHLKKKG